MATTTGNSLSIFSLFDALRRRKFILIASTIFVTAAFAIFAYVQQDRYRGMAVIAAAQTTPPEYLRHVAPPPLNIQDHLWTVREALYSDPILQAAAKESNQYRGLHRDLSPDQLEQFKQSIGVKIDSEHSFQLTYETGNRSDAMNITNKLADLFVHKASAEREQKTTEAATVIDDQLDALKQRLETQSRQMHDYKTKAVNALPDHIDDNLRNIESTRGQILDRETKI